jgi:hypothetical protein
MTETHYTIRQLAELAGMLSQQTPWIAPHSPLSENAISDYWVASQCRLERWNRFLHQIESNHAWEPEQPAPEVRTRYLDWVEEILVCEMVTRIWTALTTVAETLTNSREGEPVVRRVYWNHLEVRRRLLKLLVTGHRLDPAAAVSVNQTRRRVERWTDLLLGYIMQRGDVSEFAFSPDRVHDHLEGLRYENQQAQGHYTWPLILSSLRSTFSSYSQTRLPNQELSQRIELSILARCGSDQIDSVGHFRSYWQARLDQTSDDAAMLLQQLMD